MRPLFVGLAVLCLLHCGDEAELCDGGGGCSLMPHGSPHSTVAPQASTATLELGTRHLTGLRVAEGQLDFAVPTTRQAAMPTPTTPAGPSGADAGAEDAADDAAGVLADSDESVDGGESAQQAAPTPVVFRLKARVVYTPRDGLAVFPLESLDAIGWSCEREGDWLTGEGGSIECEGGRSAREGGSRSPAVRWPLSGTLERTSTPPSRYKTTAQVSERLTFHATDGGAFRGVATYSSGGNEIDCY